MFGSIENPSAISSLVVARIVYAINWLNVGAIYVLMSSDLGSGLAGLGTLTAAFYLGIGLMQVPGGLLAARWGLKRTVTTGIFLSSIAALGTAVAPNIWEIALLRFFVGTGMAFVFAPGVVLVAMLFKGGGSGIGVGLFNSAFDLGGLVGIFGWVVLATSTGWRPSLAISGAIGILSGVLVLAYVPGDKPNAGFAISRKVLYGILGDSRLVLLGIFTLGFGVSNVIISSFMTAYLVNQVGLSAQEASLIASMVVFVPIFIAVWGGRLYDRTPRPRRLMLASMLGGSLALALAAVEEWYFALACAVIGGVVSGIGYTFAFAAARDLNRADEAFDGLAIAWVNAISLTGSFLPPIFFSAVAGTLGYAVAWLGSGVLGLAFVLPLMLMGDWVRT